MDRYLPLSIARTYAQQAVGHDGHARNNRRQPHSEDAERSAPAALRFPSSATHILRYRRSQALGPPISEGIFAQCRSAQVSDDALGIHGLTRNRVLDRIVNNGRRFYKTIVRLIEAELSQCLVHVQKVRELTQARAISPLPTEPLAPSGGSVMLSKLVDQIDDDRTPRWCHDNVGGRQIPMDDSSAVQGTDPGGNSFDDLASCRNGAQVGRANFRIEGTSCHIVVNNCPAAII